MGDLHGLTFLEFDRLRVGLGLEASFCTASRVILCHGFPVLGLVVPVLEIDTSVHLPALQTADGVTSIHTGCGRCGTGPVIGRVIRCIRRDSVQTRDAVERYIP